ncbi:MAG: signal peptidase I [Deltaproteobacteria bacterium]|nr:signal peptidase I [Deltaproteobacteria bacterium]
MSVVFKTLFWLAVLFALLFGVGVLFFKVRTAPDDSMAPNLMAGDKFLLCYRCDIEKGDAVLCDHPDPTRKGVKVLGRVVGMEGDRVEIRRGLLRVNDSDKNVGTDSKLFRYWSPNRAVQSMEYMVWEHASLFGEQVPVLYAKDAGGLLKDHEPVAVKRGHYFLIGDHRPLTLGWTADGQLAPGGGCNSSFCYDQVPANNCRGVVYFVHSTADRGIVGGTGEDRWGFMP